MIIVIAGPTCVGKTKLSIELSHKLNGEVINADSTQVYRGMDIATAKVTDEEKEGVLHHLFDIKNIEEEYSIYDYQKDARMCIDEILARDHVPILVGGTGLYIKAALYDYQFEEEDKYDFSMDSDEALYEQLLQVDPNTNIHKNNRKRIERALCYFKNSGKPMSAKKTGDQLVYDNVVWIGLTTDREVLYNKINERTDGMMNQGLLEEARGFFDGKVRSKAVMTPIGYKELFPYFAKERSLEECIGEIKRNSRRYAKRQYTFFRHQLPMTWFDVDYANFDVTVTSVYSYIVDKFSSEL